MKDKLVQLGLSEKESIVFEVVASFDGIAASTIAHRTGIKRASMYDILRSLEKRGLVASYLKKGYKYFFVDGIETIVAQQSTRLKIAHDVVKELREKRQNTDFEITQLKDAEGFSQMYKNILLSGAREFIAWSNFESFDSIIHPDEDEEWTQKRISKGTTPRLIMVDNEVSRVFQEKDKKYARKTKRIHSKNNFSSTLVVHDDLTYIFDRDPEVVVMQIRSKNIASMLKEIFDAHWSQI